MNQPRRRAALIMAASVLLASGFVLGDLIDDKSATSTASAPTPTGNPSMLADLPSVESGELGERAVDDYDSATEIMNRHAAHFKCGDHPEGDKLKISDLIPTGNVVMTIEYDRNTKSYRVIKADPRIKVQYYVGTNPSFDGPEAYEDVFALHTKKGVEIYSWYVEYLSPDGDGKTTWVNGDADFTYGGNDKHRIVASRNRHNTTVRYVVVATDTTTCKPGRNTTPKEMWPALISSGEHLPSH